LPITGILTGAEIQDWTTSGLVGQVDRVNLFCRVTPAQKNRIILCLKEARHTVGYLGDGINDVHRSIRLISAYSVDAPLIVAKAAAENDTFGK